MLYIGSDHGGFQKKEEIKKLLQEMGVEFTDVGNAVYDPDDDYPDFARKVAEAVSKNPDQDRGILLCRSGVGVDVAANKYPNVRSSLIATDEMARFSRLHDNANVLSLAADYLTERETFHLVKTWLQTPFSGEERHMRRLKKLDEIEKAAQKSA
ncbi:MAG: RpiB/LacA/LacB family sugar-phosphate isomerase [bacterium]|nr:RpiB/LacA/LacB family sugar-phosphate isomerase [bacterium]